MNILLRIHLACLITALFSAQHELLPRLIAAHACAQIRKCLTAPPTCHIPLAKSLSPRYCVSHVAVNIQWQWENSYCCLRYLRWFLSSVNPFRWRLSRTWLAPTKNSQAGTMLCLSSWSKTDGIRAWTLYYCISKWKYTGHLYIAASFKLAAAHNCGLDKTALVFRYMRGDKYISSWLHPFIINFTRQSDGSCTDDLSQLMSRKFHSCIGVFEHTSNLGHFTNASLESHCNQNCSNYIWNLLTALATNCGNSPVSSPYLQSLAVHI